MRLRLSGRITVTVSVLGALLATGLGVEGATAAAQPTAKHAAEQVAPTRVAMNMGSAKAGGTKYTRTKGWMQGPYTATFYRNQKVVGVMRGSYTQTQNLNVKSGTWKRKLQIHITSATGAAKGGVSMNIKVQCGKGAKRCSSSGAVTQQVRKGRTAKFNFTINSNVAKNKVHTYKPVLLVTSTAPGYTPAIHTAPAMRSVRCDRLAITNGGKEGCVYSSVVPKFSISRSNPKWGAMAKHVYEAQRTLKGKPGYAKPLHRATSAQAKKNRGKSCPSKGLPRPPGKQCDEYPYASAKEGGADKGRGAKCNMIDPNATQSCRMIAKGHNHEGGQQLSKFYNNNRVIPDDPFWSIIK